MMVESPPVNTTGSVGVIKIKYRFSAAVNRKTCIGEQFLNLRIQVINTRKQ